MATLLVDTDGVPRPAADLSDAQVIDPLLPGLPDQGHHYTHRPEALTASITARIEAMTDRGRPVGAIYHDPDEPPPF